MGLLIQIENQKGEILYSIREEKFPKEISIGKDKKCTWPIIDDDSVSKIHAVISKRRNNFVLTDMHSKNGVYNLDGKEIKEIVLKPGLKVYIGQNKLSAVLTDDKSSSQRKKPHVIEYLNDNKKLVRTKLEKQETIVGRGTECDIVLPDHEISLFHFYLRIHDDGSCWILDKNSTNGTMIDGEKIKYNTERLLKNGNSIKVGYTELIFLDGNIDPTPQLVSVAKTIGVAVLLFVIGYVGIRAYQYCLLPNSEKWIAIARQYIKENNYEEALRALDGAKVAHNSEANALEIAKLLKYIVNLRAVETRWKEARKALLEERFSIAVKELKELTSEHYSEAWSLIKREMEPGSVTVISESEEVKPASSSAGTEREKAIMSMQGLEIFKDYRDVIANETSGQEAYQKQKKVMDEFLSRFEKEQFFSDEDTYILKLVNRLNEGCAHLVTAIDNDQELLATVALLKYEKPEYQTIIAKLGELGQKAEGKTKKKANILLPAVKMLQEEDNKTHALMARLSDLDFYTVEKFRNEWKNDISLDVMIEASADLERLKKSIMEKTFSIQRQARDFHAQFSALQKYGIDCGTEHQAIENFLNEKNMQELYSFEWIWEQKRLPSRKRHEPVNICDRLLDMHNFMEFLSNLKVTPLMRPPANINRFSPDINQCFATFEAASRGIYFMERAENKDCLKGKAAQLYKNCQEIVEKCRKIIENQLARQDIPGSREYLVSRGIALYLTPDNQNESLRKDLIEAYDKNLGQIMALNAQYEKLGFNSDELQRTKIRRKLLETGFPVDDKLGQAWADYFELNSQN